MVHEPREIELRRRTYQWLSALYEAAGDTRSDNQAAVGRRLAAAPAAVALVDALRSNLDLEAFRSSLHALTSPSDSPLGLSGPNGQMVVNQVANYAVDRPHAAGVLATALTAPDDEADAAAKISSLVELFADIRRGSAPQAGRAAPLASVFWSLAQPARWPARWSSAGTAFERLGWTLPTEPATAYVEFTEVIRSLGDPEDVLGALAWFSSAEWPGLDPTIEARVEWAHELKDAGADDEAPAAANVEAILGPLRQAGDALSPTMTAALGREVSKRIPPKHRVNNPTARARYDGYVSWTPTDAGPGWSTTPEFRLWFGHQGVLVGLHPGYRSKGWSKVAMEHLAASPPLDILPYSILSPEADQAARPTDVLVGQVLAYDDLEWDRLPQIAVDAATLTASTLLEVLTEGPNWGADTQPAAVAGADPELEAAYHEWVAERGYPTAGDEAEAAERRKMARLLARDSIANLSVTDFRWIMNTRRWGFAGNRSILNVTIGDPDEDAAQQQIAQVIGDLLYGPGSAADRLDRCPEQLKGLGQAGASKLLSIVFPDEFLPIHPLTGPKGKLALLPAMGITSSPTGTLGERAVQSNDLIRARLSTIPALADDPWGQMVFAYWLSERDAAAPEDPLEARLAAATESCTLAPESPFLAELVSLLEDKGQIVLYGPPGTGKTYLALALAEALAPDDDCRSLVQFHPSMSYEDFMEGFRPVLRDGQLTYELQEGPLIELANHAAIDPRTHVMIIDEMNRANLPKVFGELLFLLEYRDRPMQLAYRSTGSSFVLPKNLWIIGTMNLADRSVGQIDAALRRRFAFVPFTPGDEHNGGLLQRWLAKRNQPTWPADLVDAVNAELEVDLGHADLLIGPSYFMRDDLGEEDLARVWRYAIEPLTSDLFHGDEARVRKYEWRTVAVRHSSILPSGAPSHVTE